MKKWMKIVLGVVAFLVLAIAAVFYLTSGMVDTANAFFKAVKERDIAKARSYLSEDFKANTDEEALTDFLSKSAILNFKESNWSHRQISGGRGELEGSITTETGGVVPIKMTLVKENGSWKIYGIQKPAAGLQPPGSSPAAPGKAEQTSLVKKSMHDFIVSVNQKSMEHFRSTVSQLWQKQATAEQLTQAFKSVIDSGLNLSVLNDLDPTLVGEPKIDDDGVLSLAGYYSTDPNVHFTQKFIYEGLSWKLFGFKIYTK
ncbi:MAG: hypothetical protein ABSG91_09720 [Syntrophobacteraceae bacterium]|jgi:hypothetical protein